MVKLKKGFVAVMAAGVLTGVGFGVQVPARAGAVGTVPGNVKVAAGGNFPTLPTAADKSLAIQKPRDLDVSKNQGRQGWRCSFG